MSHESVYLRFERRPVSPNLEEFLDCLDQNLRAPSAGADLKPGHLGRTGKIKEKHEKHLETFAHGKRGTGATKD